MFCFLSLDVMCLILLFTQVVLFALFSPGLPLLPYYIQVTDYNIITQFRKILFAFALQRSNMLSGFNRLQANLAYDFHSDANQSKYSDLFCVSHHINFLPQKNLFNQTRKKKKSESLRSICHVRDELAPAHRLLHGRKITSHILTWPQPGLLWLFAAT